MRTSLFVIIILITIGCKSQHPKNKEMNSKNTEKEIEKLGYGQKERDTLMMKNGKLDTMALKEKGTPSSSSTPTDDGWKTSTRYDYEELLTDGTNIQVSGDELSGYSKTIREKNSDFEMYYTYYPSGDLKLIGQAYTNSFSYGVRYWFSESGEIEKYIDFDAPYKYTWEDVQLFLKKHEVQREDIYQIGRTDQEDIPKWYISFKTKELENTDNVQQYILNGVTGVVLKKELLDISRELD